MTFYIMGLTTSGLNNVTTLSNNTHNSSPKWNWASSKTWTIDDFKMSNDTVGLLITDKKKLIPGVNCLFTKESIAIKHKE